MRLILATLLFATALSMSAPVVESLKKAPMTLAMKKKNPFPVDPPPPPPPAEKKEKKSSKMLS